MKIEIIQSEYGYANLKFNERPPREVLDELKSNGWGWSSNNGVWYPRTADAKANDQMFAWNFIKKYDPETAQQISNQQVDDYANEIKESINPQEKQTLAQTLEDFVKPIVEKYQREDEEKYQDKLNSLNEKSKQVYELLKSSGELTVEEMLNMVGKIDQAYSTNNFEIETPVENNNVVVEPNYLHSNELSWEELQNKIILDSDGITQLQNMERFQNLKDTRIQENPLETTKESKTMVAFEYLYDVVDWDVLVETERELNSDDDYHSKMMELRASILDKVCEKLVEGSYENIDDFTANFNILRDEAIANISKEYIQNPVVQNENNLSPDSVTLAYDRVTNRYNEQYADFYKTFAQIQEMQLENESRYVGNARIRDQYNQVFEELVKLSKQELVDIICEGINFEDSKSSAIRYINSVSPDVQQRMMCTTFGFKNYLDIDNRPTLGRMENGKYIAPTSEEINTYIKDEFDCNHYNGISIAELFQIKREVRDEGLPVKKMQTFINQYEEAKNTGDRKTIKKIEYYLEDINYHSEVDLLRNGNYEELRKEYATIDFCVIPVVGEFDVANPAHYDSYQEAVDTMLALNEAHRDEIDYGISLHYNDGDYENGDAIPVYVPGKGIDTTIFEVDSHFRTNVAKKETNDFLHYLNEQLSTNYEIDFVEIERKKERTAPMTTNFKIRFSLIIWPQIKSKC